MPLEVLFHHVAASDLTTPADRDLGQTPIYETRTSGLYSIQGRTDAAHNLFLAWEVMVSHSNETYVYVRKVNPAGATVAEWIVRPPADGLGDKLDSAALMPAGADLWVLGTTHEISSAGDRHSRAVYAVLAGVFAPYGGLSPDAGASFDSRSLGTPPDPPASGGPTLAEIQTAMHSEIAAQTALWGGEGPRLAVMHKVWDGLIGLLDPANPDARAALYRALLSTYLHDNPGLYARLRETMYEVLLQHGLIPPHAADRAVSPQPLPGLPPELAAVLDELRAAGYDLPPE